jgi:hypothetical protein
MKSQHNYNYNLQLYPTESNIKIVQIPLQVKANGVDFIVPFGYNYFFDNDAELNNSIITGLSVMTAQSYNPGDNAVLSNTSSYAITLKGKNDLVLVDNLPLHNLNSTANDVGDNPILNYRSVKRFNLKLKFDKCFISSRETITYNGPLYIYLAVFYKPTGTTNL